MIFLLNGDSMEKKYHHTNVINRYFFFKAINSKYIEKFIFVSSSIPLFLIRWSISQIQNLKIKQILRMSSFIKKKTKTTAAAFE